jgi:hypothetical protein
MREQFLEVELGQLDLWLREEAGGVDGALVILLDDD